MKVKLDSLMVPSRTKREFVKAARKDGMKFYVAAEQAILEWIARRGNGSRKGTA